MDRHVAHVAHQIRPATVDRLVEEAIGRFMPDTAEEIAAAPRTDGTSPSTTGQVSFAGTVEVYGELDLADALDLDAAIRGIAGQLADLGCDRVPRRAPVDGRRGTRPPPTRPRPHHPAGRPTSRATGGSSHRPRRRPRAHPSVLLRAPLRGRHHRHRRCGELQVGRVENTRSPITADTIRDWCGHPDTEVIVKPVIDLTEHVHVESYEIPDRTHRTDRTCATAPASSPGAPVPPDPATPTTSSPTPAADPPARSNSPPCADDTTGSRPTAPGPTPPSNPAPTSGPARTATSSSATTPAPSTSPATDGHRPTHPRTDHPAPHPAPPAGPAALRRGVSIASLG